VDDVLARSNIHLVGPQAVSAVQFEHPGFMLCPIEDPSEAADGSNGSSGSSGSSGSNGGCRSSKLQTLGAFVCTDLLDDGSSCCSGESDSGSESGTGSESGSESGSGTGSGAGSGSGTGSRSE
jgi:hypothetical protein